MSQSNGVANDLSVSALASQAGIKRDGTRLDGNYYSDGQWCRWRLGRPKKMGGFLETVNGLNGPIRQLYTVAGVPMQMVHAFSGWGVQSTLVDNNGLGGGIVDRTPAGFATGDKYCWQVSSMFDSGGGGHSIIVAHAAEVLGDIAGANQYPVYYGASDGGSALVTTGKSVDGGCCTLGLFLFMYGSNGLLRNSAANAVTDYTTSPANEVNVCGTKIVRGMQIRGGSASPAGLFWSLDSVIRVTFTGNSTKWNYDTLTDQSSILTPACPVEYDGVIFWIGIDRFLVYNGVVQELPNAMNSDWFFDNLNWSQRMKVWGTKVPRWGEIWWYFPKGDSVECNWAIVYNVREKTWYDTPIAPQYGTSGRSAGAHPRILSFPMLSDSLSNSDVNNFATGNKTRPSYRLYRHEFGVDASIGGKTSAIPSAFETMNFGVALGGANAQGVENANKNTRITKVEPDFVQTGKMTMVVTGQPYPNSSDEESAPIEFAPDGEKIEVREQRRLMRLRFESNELGGNYHMGHTMIHIEPGDDRP